MIPGKTFDYVLKRGVQGHSVFALQLNLNLLRKNKIVEDGDFGLQMEDAVKQYQRTANLVVDGIAGGATQKALGRRLMIPAWRPYNLPVGLPEGLVESESSWYVGTVNWGVAGGVDLGWIQDRVTWGSGGPESVSEDRWRQAYSGPYGGAHIGNKLRNRHDTFWGARASTYKGITTHRRAWELAALWHNYPYGADKLARYGENAMSEESAQWVLNIGVEGVESPADWCRFYIQRVTRYVATWTT